jgi:competence protein ComEA
MKMLAWLLAVCTFAIAGSAHAQEAPCRVPADVEQVYPRVDLNHADEAALLGLPGIGETRARAIVAYRSAHGGFRNLSQLLQVKGIGRALLKRLRPLVTL